MFTFNLMLLLVNWCWTYLNNIQASTWSCGLIFSSAIICEFKFEIQRFLKHLNSLKTLIGDKLSKNTIYFTWSIRMIPSARVLKPRIVRFLYRFRRWSKMWSLFPSLFKKWGYWRQKVTSNEVSSAPFDGNMSSLDLNVRLLECIFTAMDILAISDPNGFKICSLVNVKVHSLRKDRCEVVKSGY